MNRYNPKIHHRKSIRLKGYDYSQTGLYFITICCQNRRTLFSNIENINFKSIEKNQAIELNEAGKMIEKWYYELENKFKDIKCHEMVVMPDHFHCIIENIGKNINYVGADLKNINHIGADLENINLVGADLENINLVGADLRVCPPDWGNHNGSPLYKVLQWFKTMTTNEYIRGVKSNGWKPFNRKLWQRNYYEHIIRNKNAYKNITNYIKNNPSKWIEQQTLGHQKPAI
jgi:REP element-mobilizing transposase RayT